ncbi:transposase [Streptomyces sp. NPDC126499]|uniref:transposase n=1 Tax=Streptomyces sp. NPDC126499 TaxID=3155314 RepID=UPI00331D0DAB
MWRGDLTNAEWVRLEPHLPATGRRGGRWNDHRRVINGILFWVRTGIPWRNLSERFGSWKSVYERHRRWSADGTWDRILRAVQADADLAGRKGGRPAGFDSEIYKRRNEVERTIKRLKNSRAIATRYDKRAYVFHGTVTAATIRLWLRP